MGGKSGRNNRRNIMNGFMIGFALLGIVSFAAALLFISDKEGFWLRIAGNPDTGQVDFASLRKTGRPNEGLACPDGFCPNAEADIRTGTYAVSPSTLREQILQLLEGDQNYRRVDGDQDKNRLRYVAYSPSMRFPDLVNIKLIDLEPEKSSIAVHARAQLGYSDNGANLRRIKRILRSIERFSENPVTNEQ